MPVTNAISLPKGNGGMTLYGTSNDDSTVTLPDIGFNFIYNGSSVRQLYSSGNTWVGFGASSEHLTINRRDTSYNSLFYAKEVEYGVNLFRIRFEGNSSYSSWGSNNLIWEVSVFETGVIRLVVEKTPNNASSSFVNPGVGTQTLTLASGKSYIFTPSDVSGKNYIIQEGTYIPCISKYLMVDDEGVKNYQTISGVSSWVKIGDLPLTENMFKSFGIDTVPASVEGVVGAHPILYYYTDNPETIENKNNYKLQISEVVTSNPKVIIQDRDFNIDEGKTINKIEAVISLVRKDTSGNDISTNGKIKMAISADGGISYLTFNTLSAQFEESDIDDINTFLINGINPSSTLNIDYNALNGLIASQRKIRFAYILEKPTLIDVCKLKKIKIFYN